MATGVSRPVNTARSIKFVVRVDAEASFGEIPTIARMPKIMAIAVENITARRRITMPMLRHARITAGRG